MIYAFVDFTNFYRSMLRGLKDQPHFGGDEARVKAYVTEWFSWGRAVEALVGAPPTAVWIDWSKRGIGWGTGALSPAAVEQYMKWADRQVAVTTCDSTQTVEEYALEPFPCPHCKQVVEGKAKGEKGLDTAVSARMFDTEAFWQTALLFSNDSDFAPAIRALRRRGKFVSGVGWPALAAPALIRECYAYLDLYERFIMDDVRLWRLLGKGGAVERLRQPVAATHGDLRLRVLRRHRGESPPRVGHIFVTAHYREGSTPQQQVNPLREVVLAAMDQEAPAQVQVVGTGVEFHFTFDTAAWRGFLDPEAFRGSGASGLPLEFAEA